MDKHPFPEGKEKQIAEQLEGLLYPLDKGCQIHIAVAGETDPQAQYFFQVNGTRWSSRINLFGQRSYLPQMDQMMETAILQVNLKTPQNG